MVRVILHSNNSFCCAAVSSLQTTPVSIHSYLPCTLYLMIWHISLTRLEGIGGLPAHWDPQPIGHNGRSEICHVVTVPPDSQEFKDALQNFQKALPPSKCQIIELRRIQNPHMFKQYSTLKAQMKQEVSDKCQLERQLFHGTDKATCEAINHQGFNRTFAGKHGNCTHVCTINRPH